MKNIRIIGISFFYKCLKFLLFIFVRFKHFSYVMILLSLFLFKLFLSGIIGHVLKHSLKISTQIRCRILT